MTRLRSLAPALALLAGLGLIAGCQPRMQAVAFLADDNPQSLADWHVVEVQDGFLRLNEGVVPYDVNAKLFSDYAYKLRTVWMPEGKSAQYDPSEAFRFPVGTIISKTFFYPLPDNAPRNATDVAQTYRDLDAFVPGKGLQLDQVRLIETRLLIHREDGWATLPYVWNDAQTHASLMRIGDAKDLVLVDAEGKRTPFTYVVPNTNQCAVCHNYALDENDPSSDRVLIPIGPQAAHLNREFAYQSGTENQLSHWESIGYLQGMPNLSEVPRMAQWDDPTEPLAARARAYLDANCSYCHNPHGEANYTSLWLEEERDFGMHIGLCKTPVAAGPATDDRTFDIIPGKPDASILSFRVATTEVGKMMPELGRTTADRKGVALIRQWIASLEGNCNIVYNHQAAP